MRGPAILLVNLINLLSFLILRVAVLRNIITIWVFTPPADPDKAPVTILRDPLIDP